MGNITKLWGHKHRFDPADKHARNIAYARYADRMLEEKGLLKNPFVRAETNSAKNSKIGINSVLSSGHVAGFGDLGKAPTYVAKRPIL